MSETSTIANLIVQMKALTLDLIDQKIQEGQLALTVPDVSAEAWKTQYLWENRPHKFSNRLITTGQIDKLLDWIVVKLADITAGTFDPNLIKYLTCNVGTAETGKIGASVQNLLITGVGVKPTVPSTPTLTPISPSFDLASDILPGQWALNITDNKWYFRKGDTIYDLKTALTIIVADIPGLQTTLTGIANDIIALQEALAEHLTIADITGLQAALDALTAAIGVVSGDLAALDVIVTAHTDDATIHFTVDGTTIKLTAGVAGVDSDAINAMIDVLAPISKDVDGKLQLNIHPDQFEIVGDALTLKAGAFGIASDVALGVVMIGAFTTIDGDGKINPNLGSGILAWDATAGTLIVNSSKSAGVIYEIDLGSIVAPDSEVNAIGYDGIFYATKVRTAAGQCLTDADITASDIVNWNAAYAALIALTPGGYAKSTFANADLDGSFQYEFIHNLGSDDVVVHVYDSVGQEQPVLKTNSTVNKTIIGCQAAITGTWKAIARL